MVSTEEDKLENETKTVGFEEEEAETVREDGLEEDRGAKELERDDGVVIKVDTDGNNLESSVEGLGDVERTNEGDGISETGLENVEGGRTDSEFR